MTATVLTIRSGDLNLEADAHGDPDARPVVLLHGGGQTRHSWGQAARTLADRGLYAVSVDLRGHGGSDWAPQGDYSLDAMIGDLAAVLSRLSSRPILVGASTGGIISMLAEAESDRGVAEALVLVDIAPRIEHDGAGRILSFMTAAPEGYASLQDAGRAVSEYLPNRRQPADLAGLRKNLRQGGDGRWRWHWDPAFLASKTREQILGDDRGRFVRAAKSLRLPTLLIRGARSDILSMHGAQEFLALCSHAKFVDVAEASHMVAGDSNDIFTESVLGFIADLRVDSVFKGKV